MARLESLFAYGTCEPRLFSSGEGGIRTPGRVAPTPVFKTGAAISERPTLQQDTDSVPTVLPTGLPKAVENDPDLRAVVEAWPTLADAMKRAIVALVEAADPNR